MLSVPASFPFPGAKALFQGVMHRIVSARADGRLSISRIGGPDNASANRLATLDELVDPQRGEENVALLFRDASEATRRLAVFVDRALQDFNTIALHPFHRHLREQADQRACPQPRDSRHVCEILRQLGWRRAGFTGSGADRSPMYRRAGTAALTPEGRA